MRAALLLVLLLVLAACSDAGTEEPVAEDDPSAAGDDAASGVTEAGDDADEESSGDGESVSIGLIAAEQGNIAFAGTGYIDGANLAIEELNSEGGDLTYELRVEEGSEVPEEAVNAANRLIADEVDGIICCILSPVAGAVKPVTEGAEVPLIIYGATLPGLPAPPLTYRSAVLPQESNAQLAQQIVENADISTIAYVVTADNEGMVSQLEAFQGPIEEAGIEDLGTTETLAADTDFSGPADEVIAKSPDAVFVSSLGEPSGGMIRTLRERGYEGIIVANATVSTAPIFETAGDALVGVPFPVEYSPVSDIPAAQEFTTAFEDAYGEAPDTFASQGYVAVRMIAMGAENAFDSAGNVDGDSLTSGLESIETMDTVWGEVTMTDGQATADSVLFVTWTPEGEVELFDFSQL